MPLLAFTPGDPGGIGPEVSVAALRSFAVRRECRPLAVGSREVFARAGWKPALAPLLACGPLNPPVLRRPSGAGGLASYEPVRLALRLAARGLIDGLVTAPVSKESWRMAGVKHLDQTALIAAETGGVRTGMMLAAGPLRAVLVTRHVPFRRVPAALTAAALEDAALAADEALRGKFGIRRPSLGLCALNPHAGENGLLGMEERELLGPAAARLRRKGLSIEGPLAADAAWAAHRGGRYDALLALYHDQALIPLKTAARYGVVNWTIGAPVLRTAPGHGTAFDIAGRGRADPAGMIAAALFAARVARARGLA